MFLGPQKLERGSVTRRDFTSQNVFREPMTDNPMSSAHQKERATKATVELPGVLEVAPTSQATDRICASTSGFTRTHNLRPAKETGKNQTSSSALDIHCTAMYLSEP
jgi:hypothetical protein